MKRPPRLALPLLVAVSSAVLSSAATTARADVPAGYKGTPFDPAVAGGAGVIPTTVKAGPYTIPGRLDLINYDLGGSGVTFSAAHHETKGGAGYRTDTPTASLSLTAQSKPDVWYMAGALEGMFYPSATTEDFYVGALDTGDWFDYTVNVETAGTYTLSTTWATGNGPPGGEGGDGTMAMQLFVNGTMMVDWHDSFPNFMTKASYHNWKPYPSFATVTLDAGMQVIKVQCGANHLNFDYLDFELSGADGGAGGAGTTDAGATSDAGGAAGATGGAGTTGTTGAAGTSGAAGTTGGAAGADATGGGGASAGVGGTTSGAGGVTGTGGDVGGGAGATGAAGTPAKGGNGCAFASTSGESAPRLGGLLALLCASVAAARARRRAAAHPARRDHREGQRRVR